MWLIKQSNKFYCFSLPFMITMTAVLTILMIAVCAQRPGKVHLKFNSLTLVKCILFHSKYHYFYW